MSNNTRKLSAFRQLSLNSDPGGRRKTFKKQFSEDIPDWFEQQNSNLKISLNTIKTYHDRPHPVKIAWDDDDDGTPKELNGEDVVIVKKIPEVRRRPSSKLIRHASLEKDSILCNNKPNLKENNNKEKGKPNLQIFLAHSIDVEDQKDNERKTQKPKLIPPLIVTDNSKNLFQIRKSKNSPREKMKIEPVVETERICDEIEHEVNPKPIDNIIIKPSSAASKREMFKKRTNSAFNSSIKEKPTFRPPLMRSLSAPHKSDQNKSKFLATKRKVKACKRIHAKSPQQQLDDTETDKENPLFSNHRRIANGSDIVTMVSLVSPAGSDNEDTIEEDKEPQKTKLKTQTSNLKNNNGNVKEENELPKNTSLKKIVKQVSFQQSSIHAIRSFSASFPSRRASIATTLMLPNNNQLKNLHIIQKSHEKRATNVTSPDANERGPKRRFVRNGTSESFKNNENAQKSEEETVSETSNEALTSITINLQKKTNAQEQEDESFPASSHSGETNNEMLKVLDLEKGNEKNSSVVTDELEANINDGDDGDKPKFESVKEKLCWDMYCKMSDKGINVSYDTILRGMLTPTEYRIKQKKFNKHRK